MPRVADTALLKARGVPERRLSSDAPLQTICEAVYHLAHAKASLSPTTVPTTRATRPGVRAELVLKYIIETVVEDSVSDSLNEEIRKTLRAANMVVCLTHGPNQTPVYFISDEPDPNLALVVQTVRQRRLVGVRGITPTDAERRLTPHEAGEDRVPDDVKFRTVKPAAHPSTKRRAELESLILEFFDETEPHVFASYEVAQLLLGVVDVSSTTVRDTVVRLAAHGRLVSRLETIAERRLRGGGGNVTPRGPAPMLYSRVDPVPIRTVLPAGVAPLTGVSSTSPQLQQHLIAALASGPVTTPVLLEQCLSLSPAPSITTVRRALRLLVEEGRATRTSPSSGRAVAYALAQTPAAPPASVPEPRTPAPAATPAADALAHKQALLDHLAAATQLAHKVTLAEDETAELRRQLAEVTAERDALADKLSTLRKALA